VPPKTISRPSMERQEEPDAPAGRPILLENSAAVEMKLRPEGVPGDNNASPIKKRKTSKYTYTDEKKTARQTRLEFDKRQL